MAWAQAKVERLAAALPGAGVQVTAGSMGSNFVRRVRKSSSAAGAATIRSAECRAFALGMVAEYVSSDFWEKLRDHMGVAKDSSTAVAAGSKRTAADAGATAGTTTELGDDLGGTDYSLYNAEIKPERKKPKTAAEKRLDKVARSSGVQSMMNFFGKKPKKKVKHTHTQVLLSHKQGELGRQRDCTACI